MDIRKKMTRIFLLGGHDLEMLEIQHLLDNNKLQYFDNNLRWDNATVDQYVNELAEFGDRDDVTIYGIELNQYQTRVPNNYVRVDHHNDLNHLPSSIEQVAAILNIELTPYLHYVAANDKGYIPAMIAAGASKTEVDVIRQRDRQCQGVSQQDELLAQGAIANRTLLGDLMLVASESERFSPICDRLYPYQQLLIYTHSSLTYYGYQKERLAQHYAQAIRQASMYHGGGSSGYFGVAKGKYTEQELETIKQNIINLLINRQDA